ncbi:MAG: DUF4931 domain-containing protein [Candidatus Micrarchaeota archaeon]
MAREITEAEIRTDFLGRTAILTPGRAKRPHEFKAEVPKKKTPKSKCFFCPGNESLTPTEIDRTPLTKGKGWQNRVFPNKFPALSHGWKKAYGSHEIIVETPDHHKTLSQLSDNEIFLYLKMAVKRLNAHSRNKKIKYTSLFKNEWEAAGASLEHIHTQVVALPFIPPYVKKQIKACKKNCKFCKIAKNKKFPKIISKGKFLLLCPYVPKYKYEMWIVPKKHISSIVDMDDSTLLSLAKILGIAVKTQDSYLNYPPYNILYHLAPHRSKAFHMHISITPRIAKWAGFEHQTGVILNSVRPEIAAGEYKVNLRRR